MATMLPPGATPSGRGPERGTATPSFTHPDLRPLSASPTESVVPVPPTITPSSHVRTVLPGADLPQAAAGPTKASEPPGNGITHPTTSDRDGQSHPDTAAPSTPTVIVRREPSPDSPDTSSEALESTTSTPEQQPPVVIELDNVEIRLSGEEAQQLLVELINNVQLPSLSPEDARALIANLVTSLGPQASHTINQEITTFIDRQRRAQGAPGITLQERRESLNRNREPLTDDDIANFQTLRQSDVAKALGWSLSKVSRIENGEVNISLRDIKALLDYYGITDPEQREEIIANRKANKWPLSKDEE